MEEALLRAVLFGTPILLASLGALVSERSGVVNLGVEGIMALSALAAFGVALGAGPYLGLLAGVGTGVLGGMVLGLFAVTLRANQFVAGLAAAALGLGASGLLGKRYEGLPLEWTLPEGGMALLAFLLALFLHHLLYRSRFGLYLRRAHRPGRGLPLPGLPALLDRRDDGGVRVGGHRPGDPGGLGAPQGRPRGLPFRPPLLPAVSAPGQCTYTERGLWRHALPFGYPGLGPLGPRPGAQGPGRAL
jgi:hypothetical protein